MLVYHSVDKILTPPQPVCIIHTNTTVHKHVHSGTHNAANMLLADLYTAPYCLRTTLCYRQGTVDVKVYDRADNMRDVTDELDAKMREPGNYPLRLVATELTTQNMVVLPRDAYLFYEVSTVENTRTLQPTVRLGAGAVLNT